MPTQPNVLLIICDDLAYGDLPCHGNPHRRSGRLDQLHHESTRLTQYRSGPMCSPARASLMTGRHYYRTGVVDTSAGRAMMYPDEVTMAEVARTAGYSTGLFGKWHLGDSYPMRAVDQGFDEVVTFNAGYIGQLPYPKETGYTDPVLEHNGEWEQYSGYCTDIFTEEAIRFIRSNQTDPFYVHVAFNAPHTPLDIDDSWIEPYRRAGLHEHTARIYGMVDNIDANVGRLLDVLEETGLSENTILIFTSDHGPEAPPRNVPQRFNAKLRGLKGSVYDGGLRVPFFVRWPRRIGSDHDSAVSAAPIDILPTMAGFCGWSLPDDRVIDGTDLRAPLTDPSALVAERTIIFQLDRRADIPARYKNYAAIHGRYKLCRPAGSVRDELYDVLVDPCEKNDLANQHPQIVEDLRARYDHWFDTIAAERQFVPPALVVGSHRANPTLLTRQDWLGPDRFHMADEDVGYWEISVEEPGHYRMEIALPSLTEESELHFAFDQVEVERRVSPPDEMCILHDIELARSSGPLSAWVDHGNTRLGVGYISVTRVDAGESGDGSGSVRA